MTLHGKKREYYDEKFVDFWATSYEARLYFFSRDILSCSIDEQLNVPFELCERDNSGPWSRSCEIEFCLTEEGQPSSWRITKASGKDRFDDIARESFLSAAQNFPHLPDGSADQTRFHADIAPDHILVTPALLSEVFQQQLLLENTLWSVLEKIPKAHRPDGMIISLEIGEKGFTLTAERETGLEQVIGEIRKELDKAQIPPDLPSQLRFLLRVCDSRIAVMSYDPRRHIVDTDRLSLLTKKRTKELWNESFRRRLRKIEAEIKDKPSNLVLLKRAASLAGSAQELETALKYSRRIIDLAPDVSDGYEAYASSLLDFAWNNHELITKFADEILKYCRLALSKTPDKDRLYDLWMMISHMLAETDHYEEAVNAYKHIKSPDHGQIAAALERAGDLRNAIKEWEKIVRDNNFEDPMIREYIMDCEEALAEMEK